MLARLMVRAEDSSSRRKLLDVIKGTVEVAYLRLFMDYHGLQLLWSWMVDVDDVWLKAEILEILEILPISNKTVLLDSKVLNVVERWSKSSGDENSIVNNVPVDSKALPGPEETNSVQNKRLDETVNSNHELDKLDLTLIAQNSQTVMSENEQNSQDSEISEKDTALKTVKDSDSAEEKNMEVEINGFGESICDSTIENTAQAIVRSVEDAKESDMNADSKLVEESVVKEADNAESQSSQSPNEEETRKSGDEVHQANALDNHVNDDLEVERENKMEVDEQTSNIETKDSEPASIVINKYSHSESSHSLMSMIIRQKSDVAKPKNDFGDDQKEQRPIPNIAVLASKLLFLWRELKEVFRIPRLERQKRYDDEKEADKRTKEIEEKRAKGLPVYYDKTKRGNDDKDYTIAGILGTKRKVLKRTYENNATLKKSQPLIGSYQTNHQQYPKVNKEEHRKIFEAEVAQRDYQEALKKYYQELAYYNAMYGQQQPYQPPIPSEPSQIPPESFNNYYNDSYYQNNYTVQNDTYSAIDQVSNAYDLQSSVPHEDHVLSMHVTPCPTLITLANATLPEQMSASTEAIAIDNSMNFNGPEPVQNVELFNDVFPAPGTFYETPEGKAYFVPAPVDKNDKSTELNVFEDVALPRLSTSFKEKPSYSLPRNWSCHADTSGNNYYYNKVTKKSQWLPPPQEKLLQMLIDEVEEKIKESLNNEKSNPSPKDSAIDKIPEQLESSEKVQTNVVCDSNDSSQQNTPALVVEADPRKRKHLLQSTTTAAADTSTSHRRKPAVATGKIHDAFRTKMSQHIVHCLNPYRKSDCKKGRILSNEDFKYLARKVSLTFPFFCKTILCQ